MTRQGGRKTVSESKNKKILMTFLHTSGILFLN